MGGVGAYQYKSIPVAGSELRRTRHRVKRAWASGEPSLNGPVAPKREREAVVATSRPPGVPAGADQPATGPSFRNAAPARRCRAIQGVGQRRSGSNAAFGRLVYRLETGPEGPGPMGPSDCRGVQAACQSRPVLPGCRLRQTPPPGSWAAPELAEQALASTGSQSFRAILYSGRYVSSICAAAGGSAPHLSGRRHPGAVAQCLQAQVVFGNPPDH